MRNLKKILALVLALVMSLSLVTMANADYADQADIDNAEAVAVMSAIGVLQGSDGKFNPDAILSREEAAKIITYMLLGKEKADKLTTTIAPFADVAADRWSAGSIAYCADQGILDGIGGGKFDPTGKLTGLQFAKMVLCALGYDATIEGLTGETFAIKTATLAIDLGLDKDVSVDLAAQLSRENAAQLAFNAFGKLLVRYQGGTTVELPGGTKVVVGATRYNVYDGEGVALTFQDKYITNKLTKVDAEDETFKRPNSYAWKYDGEVIYTAASAATKVYYGQTKCIDIWKDLGKPTAEELTKVTMYVNGGDALVDTKKIAKDTTDTIGDVNYAVEVYFDKDAKEVTIVAIRYNVGKVTDVKADTVDKYGDVTKKAYVTIAGKEFETTAYAKDDVVLYALVGSAIKDVKLAESFEGKVTAVKGTDVTIGGAVYSNTKSLTLGSEGTFYKGVCGTIVEFTGKKAATSELYAYIYNVVDTTAEAGKTADGYSDPNALQLTAYVILADGTKASYVVSDDDTTKAADWYKVGEPNAVVCYEINSDGEFALATAADTAVVSSTTEGGVQYGKENAIVEGKYANAETDYVFALKGKDSNNKDVMNAKIVTGYKNVVKATAPVHVVYDKETNKALTVFVAGTAASETVVNKDIYVLADDAKATETYAEDGKTKLYTYDVVLKGEAAKLVAKSDVLAGEKAGTIFTITETDGYLASISKLSATEVTISSVVDEYVVISDTAVYSTADVQVYLKAEDNYALTKDAFVAKDKALVLKVTDSTSDDYGKIYFAIITDRAE